MVHFQEQRGRLRIADDISTYPDGLISEIDPYSEGTLFLVIDAANKIVAYDRIDALVKLDRRGFPAAELLPVIRLLNQVICDQASRCTALSGDIGLASGGRGRTQHPDL